MRGSWLRRPGRLLAVLLAGAAGATCTVRPSELPAPAGDGAVLPIPPLPVAFAPDLWQEPAGEPGLTLRLRQGGDDGATLPELPVGPLTGQPLGAEATGALLARLMTPPGGVAEPFRLPAASRPAPRTGATTLLPFPPPDSVARAIPVPVPAAPPERTALEVVRIVPMGEAGLAPFLTVTFSDAMVPLTTVGAVDGVRPPVRLTPDPPGRWSWIDVHTARFQPDPRFPMATRYTVEVPAGTRSAAGVRLEDAVRAEFGTSPARAVGGYPAIDPEHGHGGTGESVRLDPVIVVVFDQRVEPAAVLRHAELRVNGRTAGLRLATAAELAADSVAAGLVAAAAPGRAVAFRPVAGLRNAAEVSLRVGAGTPSAEGPRLTERAQELRFRTWGALHVVRHGCTYQGDCAPGIPWLVEFSNPLDPAVEEGGPVTVEPALPDMNIEVYGQRLHIQGRSQPGTRYRVTLAAGIRDVYGQTLGAARVLEFDVGPAPAALVLGGGRMTVLDPAGAPRVLAYSRGYETLRVRVHRVSPDDWPAHLAALRRSFEGPGTSYQPVGVSVIDARVPVGSERDGWAVTPIDLAPALRDGLGHAVLIVDPVAGGSAVPGWLPSGRGRGQPQTQVSWVQSTRIGLTAAVDAFELLGWATSLEDGAALPGVTLRLAGPGAAAVTAADGTAVVPLGTSPAHALVATRDGDSALLPENEHGYGGGWARRADGGELRWLVFSDRGLYRPGETARLKGWTRHIPEARGVQLALAAGVRDVAYSVRGPRGEELAGGTVRPGALGGFDLSVPLPEDLNLGHVGIDLHALGGNVPARGDRSWHSLQVQEFRRPDYEAVVSAAPGPHAVGGTIDAAVRAAYYAGGGLPGARVEWQASPRQGHFTPPGWDRWRFGRAPFWYWGGGADGPPQRLEGVTDGAGRHSVAVELLAVEPAFATSLRLDAQVHDVTRQLGSSGVDLLVHPALAYAGLRMERGWLRPGETAEVQVVAVDPDGRVLAGSQVELVAERIIWPRWRPGRPQSPEAEATDVRCAVVAAADPVTCRVVFEEPGQYRLRAEVRDGAGRPSRTELLVWVAGEVTGPPRPGMEPGQAELIADRESYQPGDTARVLLQAPFYPAEGLLTVRLGGVLRTERFRVAGPGHELRVPVTEAHITGVWLRAELVSDDGLRFAGGETQLAVPPLRRTLDVRVTPRDTFAAPGAQASIDVLVKDAAGRAAANAEVTLWMVDEGVLATGGYALPDPVGAFYAGRGPTVQDYQTRPWLVRGLTDEQLGQLSPGGMGGGEMEQTRHAAVAAPPPPPAPAMAMAADMLVTGKAAGAPDVAVRADFAPLALFEPALRTGADGRVTVSARLPESLTRYRIMAVAVAGADHFGAGEATLTAGKDLMVRFAAPRFLNFGDKVELPVLVQNSAAVPLEVDVAVRGFGIGFDGPAGRRVTLPPGGRTELRFDASTRTAGTAQLQVIAVSGTRSDAAAVSLPVYSPATAEAFATYGEIDGAAPVRLPLARPAGVIERFGGLEVTLTSTALHALTDAVLFLRSYPFEGAEPIASRVLAVAALRDVLGAFGAEGLPPVEALVAATQRDVQNLAMLQRPDGGWGFWRQDEPSHPFVSMHVAHALGRARGHGFAVPPATMAAALRYLQQVDGALSAWPADAREAAHAHALYVRHRLGDRAASSAARARVERAAGQGALSGGAAAASGISTEAAGWLLYVLAEDGASAAQAAELRRLLLNRVVETAGSATFTESYGEGAHLLLHSRRRTDAVVLEALIAADPRSDLIPRVVQGLLGARVQGRWSGTQENAWVLLALDRYFRTYEATVPDYRAAVWLGDRYAGGHAFEGRSTERQHLNVPMAEVLRADAPDLTVAREGAGRLYYRAGLRYAPAELRPDALDRGFTVTRGYEAVDAPEDVRRDAGGAWEVRAGARVRVTVTMVAPSVRHHVALADALPAGFEPLNPELRGVGITDMPEGVERPAPGRPAPGMVPGRPWQPTWFGHQNLRDDRAEAFATFLSAGVHEYSYLARATTPGTFIVPPPRAVMMYEPETFGRGAGDVVRVVAARTGGR